MPYSGLRSTQNLKYVYATSKGGGVPLYPWIPPPITPPLMETYATADRLGCWYTRHLLLLFEVEPHWLSSTNTSSVGAEGEEAEW